MSSASHMAGSEVKTGEVSSTGQRGLNLTPPLVFVGLYWAAYFGIGLVDMPKFTTFLWRLAVLLLVTIAMTIWWFANGRIGWRERLVVPLVTLISATVAIFLLHPSVMSVAVIIPTWQALITAWTLWLAIVRSASPRLRQAGLLAMAALFWLPMTQLRMEGMRGDGGADLFWRWTPTAEEKLLADLRTAPPKKITDSAPPKDEENGNAPTPPHALDAADWPEFRGRERNGIVHGVTIDTNWQASPPKLLWRRAVGPAWSSVAIVDKRLYTQEQRGPQEVVTCYDANSGDEIWGYSIDERFEEELGGIGPRATPTYFEGKILAQGANGWLSCLDAATGNKLWSRNIVDIAQTELPMWGYSSSPLVIDGLVFTFAGDKPKAGKPAAPATAGLLAFELKNEGELAWHAAIGKESYSSPQKVTLHGVEQLLYVSDTQFVACQPATGKQLWTFANKGMGRPTVQPQFIAPNQFVISFSPDAGVSLIEVTRDGDKWSASEKWASRNLKPDFSDYVHHDGYLYGFDNDIFCCISLADGKRMWKKGRYGAGQVLLLADQPVLLVITERGELVLVATNPQQHEELAKFQALNSKTWNHPVISRGKLYVRNAEEMACFELSPVD